MFANKKQKHKRRENPFLSLSLFLSVSDVYTLLVCAATRLQLHSMFSNFSFSCGTVFFFSFLVPSLSVFPFFFYIKKKERSSGSELITLDGGKVTLAGRKKRVFPLYVFFLGSLLCVCVKRRKRRRTSALAAPALQMITLERARSNSCVRERERGGPRE